MKLLNFILVGLAVVISIPAFSATESLASLPEFTYVQNEYSQKDAQEFHHHIQNTLKTFKLSEVKPLKRSKDASLSIDSLDGIWTQMGFAQAVFLKIGVVPSEKTLVNQKQVTQEGVLYHGTYNQTPYALFVRSSNNTWNNSVLDAILKKKASSKGALLKEMFLPSAYAQINYCSDIEQFGDLHGVAKAALAQSSALQSVFGCMIGAVKGIWNSTGGLVIDLADGAYDLATSPIETGKKYWKSVNDTWSTVEKFYQDFSGEAEKAYAGFKNLNDQDKAKLACEVVASVGTGALVSYFTGGLAASAMGPKIAAALQKLKGADNGPDVIARLEAAKSLKEIDFEIADNMFAIPKVTPEVAKAENQGILDSLNAADSSSRNPKRIAAASKKQIKDLYKKVETNPVADLCKMDTYDPKGNIGFCFGRAAAAHMEALRAGVEKEKIRKIWAVGDLSSGGQQWRYHVTTIVRGDDGKWWAIDPIMGKPLTAEDWYKKMKKHDSNGSMRIYTSQAKRFSPGGDVPYSQEGLFNPSKNGYFRDMMNNFKEESRELKKQKQKQ